jgi:metabolite-proton symporter
MMSSTSTTKTGYWSSQSGRATASSFIGTTIEWYDFYLYGTSSALVFNVLFFPDLDPLIGTIAAFGAFAAGFLVRPIGGIIFGHFGDRVGRKKMLVISLLMMGIATVLIGALPTFDQVGILAPILLVVLRLVQGLAVGGEWGGAALMSVEHAPKKWRGLAGSATQVGSPAGLLLSTGMFAIFSSFPDDVFLAWGWRVPFLISILLIAVGMFIRLRVEETPAFTNSIQLQEAPKVPLFETLAKHPVTVLIVIGLTVGAFAAFYMYATFVLTYGTQFLGFERADVLLVVSIAAVGQIILIPTFAWLSDRTSRFTVYLFGGIGTVLFVAPFFLMNESAVSIGVLMVTTFIGLSIFQASMYSVMPALYSELFPASVRYTGVSLGVQIGGALGGGLTPLFLTSLLATGQPTWLVIAPYIMGLGIICIISIVAARARMRRFVHDDTDLVEALQQQRDSTPATAHK